MTTKNFSIPEALAFGWSKFRNNLGFFIPLAIIIFVIQALPRTFGTHRSDPAFVSFLAAIFFWLLRTLVDMGIIKISLKFIDNKKAEFGDLLSEGPLLLNFLIGSAIYTLIVLVGLILFIVPGIIWGIKYAYFSYLIIDKNMAPLDAIKKSGEITKGYKWNIFLFALALIGINIVGVLLFGIGLLITLPVSYLASAYIYRVLSKS